MALAAIASSVGSYITSEVGQAAAIKVFERIFKKQQVAPLVDSQRQLVELISERPTEAELSQAFAALEARLLSAIIEEQRHQEVALKWRDRRALLIMSSLGVAQLVTIAAVFLTR